MSMVIYHDQQQFPVSLGNRNPCAQTPASIDDHPPSSSHDLGMKCCTPFFCLSPMLFCFWWNLLWVFNMQDMGCKVGFAKLGLYRIQQRWKYLWLVTFKYYNSNYHNYICKGLLLCYDFVSILSKRKQYTYFIIHIISHIL